LMNRRSAQGCLGKPNRHHHTWAYAETHSHGANLELRSEMSKASESRERDIRARSTLTGYWPRNIQDARCIQAAAGRGRPVLRVSRAKRN
jgi:hypothetical protein